MTLADILGRDLRVEWHEAVALVREVVERTPDSATVPELHQVELQPWGQLQLHGGSPSADPVQRLGQMLQALLVSADPPVQLRLLIAQPQTSVPAFSEALAFFERPERAAILQGLYHRATAAPPLANPELLAAALAVKPAADAADNTGDLQAVERPSRTLLYGAGLIALVALTAGVALYAGRSESSSPEAPTLTSRVAKGVSGVTAAVGSAVSAIGERVGISGNPGTSTAAEIAKPPAPPVATSKTKRAVGPPSRGVVDDLQRATLSAFDLNAMPEVPVVRESVVIVAQPENDGKGQSGSAAGLVYSSNSQDVSAPVGLRPQLPKELPVGVRAEDLTRIELIILPDGTVESVRLLDAPRNIHASMLLSAAKAWQFHPATKDGVPVTYRKTVWVTR